MQIVCPKCEFEQDVPDEKIPPRATLATCPKCGQKFYFREGSIYPEESSEFDFSDSEEDQPAQESNQEEKEKGDLWEELESLTEEEADTGSEYSRVFDSVRKQRGRSNVPWEQLEDYGFFPGLFATIKQVLSAPASFFKNMDIKNGFNKPLIFYLLIAEVQALAQFFWQFSGIFTQSQNQPESLLGMGMMGAGSVFILLLYPVILAVGLFIGSGVNHLCLLAVQSGKRGYEGTFRVMSYASAPMIFAVIPLLGTVVGVVWNIVCMVLGFMYVHKASAGQVVLAMLLPLLLILVAFSLYALMATIV